MTVAQAISVILAVCTFLDGKKSMPLSNVWKCRVAKAKSVLRDNNTYALTQDGMYMTIKETNGVASTTWLPVRDTSTDTSADGSLDELYQSQLANQAGIDEKTRLGNVEPTLDV